MNVHGHMHMPPPDISPSNDLNLTQRSSSRAHIVTQIIGIIRLFILPENSGIDAGFSSLVSPSSQSLFGPMSGGGAMMMGSMAPNRTVERNLLRTNIMTLIGGLAVGSGMQIYAPIRREALLAIGDTMRIYQECRKQFASLSPTLSHQASGGRVREDAISHLLQVALGSPHYGPSLSLGIRSAAAYAFRSFIFGHPDSQQVVLNSLLVPSPDGAWAFHGRWPLLGFLPSAH